VLARRTKELARRLGLEISHYRPFAARVVGRLTDGEVSLVIDVGANRGQYATELRRHGYRGRIVSFEPVEEAFEQLASAAADDTGWTCHRAALGAVAEEAPIHVASNLASSSLLEMGVGHRAAAPSVSVVGVETVRVVRLDDVLDDDRPCLLKLDVQGYEDRVLDGAPSALARALLFQCELCTGNLYSGQAPVRDIVDRLDDAGFELIDLDPIFWDGADGRVLAVDALFARRTDGVIRPREAV
jgi:FkbM family methyltransferase